MPRHTPGQVRRLHRWAPRPGGGHWCQKCGIKREKSRYGQLSEWRFTLKDGTVTNSMFVPLCGELNQLSPGEGK